MSNKITIENVDAVFERIPSATYAEAKEALIECNGDVVEAIILLEARKNTSKSKQAKKTMEDVFGKDGEELKELKGQMVDLFKKSSVIRVIVEKNNKVIVNIPLTLGVVGLALGPLYTLIGLSAAVIGKYSIKIQNEDDGTVVDLGELNEEKLNMLKQMLTNTAKDVKDIVVDKKKDDKDITEELMKEFDNINKDDKEEK